MPSLSIVLYYSKVKRSYFQFTIKNSPQARESMYSGFGTYPDNIGKYLKQTARWINRATFTPIRNILNMKQDLKKRNLVFSLLKLLLIFAEYRISEIQGYTFSILPQYFCFCVINLVFFQILSYLFHFYLFVSCFCPSPLVFYLIF